MTRIISYIDGEFNKVHLLPEDKWQVVSECLREYGYEISENVFEYNGVDKEGNVRKTRLSVYKPC